MKSKLWSLRDQNTDDRLSVCVTLMKKYHSFFTSNLQMERKQFIMMSLPKEIKKSLLDRRYHADVLNCRLQQAFFVLVMMFRKSLCVFNYFPCCCCWLMLIRMETKTRKPFSPKGGKKFTQKANGEFPNMQDGRPDLILE